MITKREVKIAEKAFWNILREWSKEKNPQAPKSPGRRAYAAFLWRRGWYWSAGFSGGGPPVKQPAVVQETAKFIAGSTLKTFTDQPMTFAASGENSAYVFYDFTAQYVDKTTQKPTNYAGQVCHIWSRREDGRLIIAGGLTTVNSPKA